MRSKNVLKLILAVAVSELAGIIGSFFTIPAVSTWYPTLAKPLLNPPAWIFAPVWTTLFALMGIAAFLIWRKGLDRRDVKIALGVFVGQLALNTLWSIIFFGWHNPGGAFLEIILLWFAILAAIIVFARISKPAAWLLVPYILWVSFAGYLNYSIWRLSLGGPEQVIYAPETGVYPEKTGSEGTGNELWKTAIDDKAGFSFRYPEKLLTEYIHVVNWPPQVKVIDKKFICVETGSEIISGGITAKRLVDDREYCLTKASEGAAGSIYTDYTYAFAKENQMVALSFNLRSVQCGNYDDPQKTACEQEREAFDPDGVADRIVRSLEWDLSRPNQKSVATSLAECLPKSDLASRDECERLLSQIMNFDDCVAAGFSIMKSNPPQCATPDGRNFVEEINSLRTK